MLFASLNGLAQKNGIFLGPAGVIGYDFVSEVYHPNPDVTPENKGYNQSFQIGAVVGFRWQKLGLQWELKNSYFEQNMLEGNYKATLEMNSLTNAFYVMYLPAPLGNSGFYHTLKGGIGIQTPRNAHYQSKNLVEGTIYSDEDQLDLMQTQYMLALEYGLSMGHKLLWADFSLQSAYGLNSVYQPGISDSSRIFYIGFKLAFGLFLTP
jgi:hypothetical protein